jgi:phosphofructokinase-like protein
VTKKIGILTSGGDCAGLNATIRAVVHRAISTYGWEVCGIRQGTTGFLSRPIEVIPLTLDMADHELLRRGGTILGTTNKGNPFSFLQPDGTKVDLSHDIIEGIKMANLDALIGVGGDGSLSILKTLALRGGFNLVAIPKTIDNDLGITERSIGFSTAVEIAVEALDRLQPTAASHDRIMILEVMGRDAGHIAIEAGIAGGADIILIPEIPFKTSSLVKKIAQMKTAGRNYALVIIAEAAKGEDARDAVRGGVGDNLARVLTQETGAECRVTVLGHVQRGAQPLAQDRILASALGVYAVDLIAKGQFDRMVAWQNRQVVDVPIDDAIRTYHAVDTDGVMVKTARALGICLGD